MRIGIDACCWSNRRGYGRFTRELLKALVTVYRSGELVFFCDPETSQTIHFSGDAKIVVVQTSQNVSQAAVAKGNRSPTDLLRMTQAVWKEKLDWFFFPTVYSYFPILNRCKKAITIHDTTAEQYPELILPSPRDRLFWKAKTFLAIRQSDVVFTVSEFASRSIQKIFHISPKRLSVLLEAPEQAFFENIAPDESKDVLKKFELDPEKPFFMYVGGISPHKNLETLITAFSAREFENCKLLLVGDYERDGFFSDYDNVRTEVRARKLEDRIAFTGFVSDADVRALFYNTCGLILPSLEEGFGLPAVEAMAVGAPVIATRNSAIPEIAPDGALFFDPQDSIALRDAMLQLLRNPELRKRLSSAGKARVSNLSWEASAKKLIQVCASMGQ